MMMHLFQEFRFAARSLRRDPLFTVTILTIVALGIGTTTAIFTIVDALVLRGLPFRNGDRIVRVVETFTPPDGPRERRAASFPDFRDWQAGTTVFEHLVIRDFQQVAFTEPGEIPAPVAAAFVSPAVFSIVGARPAQGRMLIEEDEVTAALVAVVSQAFWQMRFGGDPSVIGRAISINEMPVQIVGVVAGGFDGVFGGIDLWMPYASQPAIIPTVTRARLENRQNRGSFVLGMLRAGASVSAAQDEIDRVLDGLHEAGLVEAARGAQVVSFEQDTLGGAQRMTLLLMGAAGLVLLIVVANVANLILVRHSARSREMVVRQALGASRTGLVRYLLVESVLVSVTGGALGAAVAVGLIDLLAGGVLANAPTYVVPSLNVPAMVFALALSVSVGLLFGLFPALQQAGVPLAEGLKAGGRTIAGNRGARQLLVGAQVTIAVVLVVGAGLMMRSITEMLRIDPGLDPTNVVVAQVDLPPRYAGAARADFARQLEQALADNVLVEHAGVASDVPMRSGYSAIFARLDDATEAESDRIRVYVHRVSPGYFDAMGIGVAQGRGFDAGDQTGSEPVVMVSALMAERVWPGTDAVGRQLNGATIVGVIDDVAYRGLVPDLVANPDDPDIFLPLLQRPVSNLGIAVKMRGSRAHAGDVIRDAVGALDPLVPVYGIQSMEDIVLTQTATSRAATGQLGIFAIIALALAAAGVYGVLAYTVARRRGEIGVRMALGADAGRVRGMVLRQGLGLVGTGLVVGLVLAAAFGRVIESQLYHVVPTDLATYGIVASVFLLVGTGAAFIPAWRATRIDPLVALRME